MVPAKLDVIVAPVTGRSLSSTVTASSTATIVSACATLTLPSVPVAELTLWSMTWIWGPSTTLSSAAMTSIMRGVAQSVVVKSSCRVDTNVPMPARRTSVLPSVRIVTVTVTVGWRVSTTW